MSGARPELERALRATGLLATFNEAGLLGLADVNAAVRLGRLAGESDDAVQLACALAVRALRVGSVCLDLADAASSLRDAEGDVADLPWPDVQTWAAKLAGSPLVTADGAGRPLRPLRLTGSRLYLQRYWGQEEAVRVLLTARAHATLESAPAPEAITAACDALFDGSGLAEGERDLQRSAAALAAATPLCVIAGGPGTGKTTTVAKLLAVLQHTSPASLRVALAAPTGKAAARLEESVRAAAAGFPAGLGRRLDAVSASTIHRLLGWQPGRQRGFFHTADNPLPFDVVVVDEMSMVSLTLMAQLLNAVRPDARLILVGDPDQLASIEAGAVMADITRAGAMRPHVVELQHTWRFSGAIGTLAAALRDGDAASALRTAREAGASSSVALVDGDLRAAATIRRVRERVIASGTALVAAAGAGDATGALRALDEHRLLCAHTTGPFGVARWSRTVELWLRQHLPGFADDGEWYVGRPLLITANSPDIGLFNGDTGVVIATPDGPRAAFAPGSEPVLLSPGQLDAVETMFAMTVHKAQGSQFRHVSLILPPPNSPLLIRELVYTAVTRASASVTMLGSAEALAAAVLRPARRASGLRERL